MQVSHRSTAPLLLLMLATACAERPSAPTAPSTEPSRVALDASAGAPPPPPLVTGPLPPPPGPLFPRTRSGFRVHSGLLLLRCLRPGGASALPPAPLSHH